MRPDAPCTCGRVLTSDGMIRLPGSADLKRLQSERDAAESECDALRARLAAVEAERDLLADAGKAADRYEAIATGLQRLAAVTAERDALTAKLSRTSLDYLALDGQCNELMAKLAEADGNLARVTAEAAGYRAQLAAIEAEREQWYRERAAAIARNLEAYNKLDALAAKLAEAEADLKALHGVPFSRRCYQAMIAQIDEMDRLAAENGRLREALNDIINHIKPGRIHPAGMAVIDRCLAALASTTTDAGTGETT